jgi:hypothetical protein
MQIQLPNGQKQTLDEHISYNDKLNKVDELVTEWYAVCRRNWNSDSVRFFLDNLANYLVWHKEPENKGKEDRYVLSVRKVEEMIGKREGKSIVFTDLSGDDKELLGLERETNE